jgi:hypothetical protein
MWLSAQNSNPIWYFDATGSIIRTIEGQSKPLLYSLVFHDKAKEFIFPLAEFLTTAQDSHSISSYLSTIKLELKRVIPKRSVQVAPVIVTDFSWALINGIMSTFNNCTADVYLNWCYDVLFKKESSYIILNVINVVQYICSTHFLKLMIKKARKVKKYECNKKNEKIRKAFVFTFTILQNSATIEEFKTNLKHAFNIFTIPISCKKSIESRLAIKKQIIERDLIVLALKNDDNLSKKKIFSKKTVYNNFKPVFIGADPNEKSLKENSPFTIYFKKYLKNHSINLRTKKIKITNEPNEHYCPQLFNIILQYTHIVPLWTGIMISQKLNTRNEKITRLSNNPVENWFGQLKNNILQSKNCMPSVMTSRVFRKVESEFDERYSYENIELNEISDSLANKKETWKKKNDYKRKKNFFYTASGLNLFRCDGEKDGKDDSKDSIRNIKTCFDFESDSVETQFMGKVSYTFKYKKFCCIYYYSIMRRTKSRFFHKFSM